MKILMVLTSHDRLGDTGKKTGFWLEEFAAPYYVFHDAGAEVVLASPEGGQPPLDPKSNEPDAQTAATERFAKDAATRAALANTHRLSDVAGDRYDAVFYPGGHGPLWDLAEDRDSIALLESTVASGTPLGVVCHAPAVFRHARTEDGAPLVSQRDVTGFSNSEEDAAGLTDVVPFLVEDMLKSLGARYTSGADYAPHVITDGTLVTGQNPASSEGAANALLALIKSR